MDDLTTDDQIAIDARALADAPPESIPDAAGLPDDVQVGDPTALDGPLLTCPDCGSAMLGRGAIRHLPDGAHEFTPES